MQTYLIVLKVWCNINYAYPVVVLHLHQILQQQPSQARLLRGWSCLLQPEMDVPYTKHFSSIVKQLS